MRKKKATETWERRRAYSVSPHVAYLTLFHQRALNTTLKTQHSKLKAFKGG